MASSSTQTVQAPAPKPAERTAEPRPIERPVTGKPWAVKIQSSIPF